MNERGCPVCGGEANTPHHVKPQTQGGTDDHRNIRWLCKPHHDLIEEMQEETGLELCPELIRQAREKISFQLEIDEESGVRESWHHVNLLVWIKPRGQPKRYINQWIGFEPGVTVGQVTGDIKLPPKRYKKERGNPGKPEIDTIYLEELINNRGLSYRAAEKQLLEEGFRMSHAAIHKRLLNSRNRRPLQKVACKRCKILFTPKSNRLAFCSPECYKIYHRDYREKKKKKRLS